MNAIFHFYALSLNLNYIYLGSTVLDSFPRKALEKAFHLS